MNLTPTQELFIACPAKEATVEGNRGSGKTTALLHDFYNDVKTGLGRAWRGILFRRTFPQLQDVINKSKTIFYATGATYNQTDKRWEWPTGEVLYFRQAEKPDDYYNFHGHEYTWIGWEELTTWPDISLYESMMSCLRSTVKGIRLRVRSTTNPYGVGHNWVKMRFIDTLMPNEVKIINGVLTGRIRLMLSENLSLLEADPDYINRLKAISEPAKRAAYLEGSWDIVAGGALDDVWDRSIHVIEPFEIPHSWAIGRSFDWGSTRPSSIGWWAISDGTEVVLKDGSTHTYPVGTTFRIAEYYTWNGNPNEGTKEKAIEIARNILKYEKEMGIYPTISIADTAIFNSGSDQSIADDMLRVGVRFDKSDSSQGSRKIGLEKIRAMLSEGLKNIKEFPCLYIFNSCMHFIRTVPILPRDKIKIDDVDTNAEDHVYDESRYFLNRANYGMSQSDLSGY